MYILYVPTTKNFTNSMFKILGSTTTYIPSVLYTEF